MEWKEGRSLSRASTMKPGLGAVARRTDVETVLAFSYDAEGIRTGKTVTKNTYKYKSVADGTETMAYSGNETNATYEQYLTKRMHATSADVLKVLSAFKTNTHQDWEDPI